MFEWLIEMICHLGSGVTVRLGQSRDEFVCVSAGCLHHLCFSSWIQDFYLSSSATLHVELLVTGNHTLCTNESSRICFFVFRSHPWLDLLTSMINSVFMTSSSYDHNLISDQSAEIFYLWNSKVNVPVSVFTLNAHTWFWGWSGHFDLFCMFLFWSVSISLSASVRHPSLINRLIKSLNIMWL